MTDLESHIRDIIKSIGDDPERDGLKKTPQRVIQALSDLTSGYNENLDEVINGAIFETPNTDMVVLRHIEFYSMCEHHMLPFFGTCSIAYFPRGKVLGLSKLARVVDHFAHRLQIQETLTVQIGEAIGHYLNTRDVAVTIDAQHRCLMMRGVNKQSSVTTTSSFMGVFKEHDTVRGEFLQHLHTWSAR